MTDEEIELSATRWVRRPANKRMLIEKYSSLVEFPATKNSLIVFLAGSPGAGKSEFIKSFRHYMDKVQGTQSVLVDPDAIREDMPNYTGANSYLFQRPISIAVDDLFKSIIKNNQSAFIDGTLADYGHAKRNITEALEKHAYVMVCYVFQHPSIAWRFTKLRESIEGRNIQKTVFIEKFLAAKKTVNNIKTDFGDRVVLNVILKDYKDSKENKAIEDVFMNVERIEDHIDFAYTKGELERRLL